MLSFSWLCRNVYESPTDPGRPEFDEINIPLEPTQPRILILWNLLQQWYVPPHSLSLVFVHSSIHSPTTLRQTAESLKMWYDLSQSFTSGKPNGFWNQPMTLSINSFTYNSHNSGFASLYRTASSESDKVNVVWPWPKWVLINHLFCLDCSSTVTYWYAFLRSSFINVWLPANVAKGL